MWIKLRFTPYHTSSCTRRRELALHVRLGVRQGICELSAAPQTADWRCRISWLFAKKANRVSAVCGGQPASECEANERDTTGDEYGDQLYCPDDQCDGEDGGK